MVIEFELQAGTTGPSDEARNSHELIRLLRSCPSTATWLRRWTPEELYDMELKSF